jgi:hypothetical protein
MRLVLTEIERFADLPDVVMAIAAGQRDRHAEKLLETIFGQ